MSLRGMVSVALALWFSFSGTGCTTVSSTRNAGPTTVSPSVDGAHRGITYFLPRRRVRFTAKRSFLDAKEIADTLKVKEKEQGEAKKANEEAVAAVKRQQDRFNTMNCGSEPSAATDPCKRVASDLAIANADAKLASKHFDEVTVEVATLKAKLLQAEGTAGDCPYLYEAKLEAMPMEPDPRYQFTLDMTHSPLRDDTLDVSVNGSGLLSSTNVIAVDRTGEILVEIAAAIASFGGVLPPMNLPKFAMAERAQELPEKKCDREPKIIARVVDPGDVPANGVGGTVSELNADLVTASFPLQLRVSTQMKDAEGGAVTQEYDGKVFYRSPTPVEFIIERCTSQNCDERYPIDSATVMLPQLGPISFIPMVSAPFVKTVSDVKFEDGMVKSWKLENPSEALEVVRLPAKVAKSMVAVPAELLKLRVDYSSQASALAENQRVQKETEAKAEQLRLCVLAAGTDFEKMKNCLPSAATAAEE